jgi:hypothetical protein
MVHHMSTPTADEVEELRIDWMVNVDASLEAIEAAEDAEATAIASWNEYSDALAALEEATE